MQYETEYQLQGVEERCPLLPAASGIGESSSGNNGEQKSTQATARKGVR